MKFSVTQKLLHAALWRVVPIVTEKTLSILNNVLFELQGNNLRLTATDLEQTVVTTVVVKGEKNGAAAFPAKKLFDLIKELPSADVECSSTEGNKLTVKTEKGEYKISGESAEEFPQVNVETTTFSFVYSAKKFARAADTVSFAASTDELRPSLMGMLLEVREHELRFVATDGHRLAKVVDSSFSRESAKSTVLPLQAIVSINALAFVARNAAGEEELGVVLGADTIRFTLGATTLYAKLCNGIYPKYERVIPTDNDLAIQNIDATELQAMLRRANMFSAEHTHQVRIVLGPKRMEVNAVQQGNESTEQISVDCNAESETLTIGCNAEYFLDNIKHLDAERILLRVKDSGSAIIFEPQEQAEGEHTMMLLMPIRLNE